ncbi:MAG: 5-formyltetrahydrofolate cyclo-ligase [Saprospiraceae bacterium]
MAISIKEQKQEIRNKMLRQRDALPRDLRRNYSEFICNEMWNLISSQGVKTLHTFLPMRSEIMLLPLIKRALDNGIIVVAPKTLPKRKMQNLLIEDLKQMESGIFGTYHPKTNREFKGAFDLIIVAGLAFDKAGYRIGYGGGYYDKFLADQKYSWKVGVCFPFQLLDKVPFENHDIPVNEVITLV